MQNVGGNNTDISIIMTLDELRQEFLRLFRHPTIQDSYDLLNIYADYFLQTIKNHHKDNVRTVAEKEATIINQMMLTKVLHIRQVVGGVSFMASDRTELSEIIDPTIVAALIRNVYETVSLFNLIYRYTKTKDEKLILYNLWVVAGLNYRQRFESIITSPEIRTKQIDEKQKIDKCISEIEKTQLYIGLDQKDKDKIQSKIKEKDFKIKFDNNKVVFLHWQELSKTMGLNHGLFDKLYTYFSLYSHPSNVSVFQFGNMFNEDQEFLGMTNHNLNYLYVLLSIFIADYIHLFPNVLKTFESQTLINQLVINGHNRFLRDDEYSINDTYKHLG